MKYKLNWELVPNAIDYEWELCSTKHTLILDVDGKEERRELGVRDMVETINEEEEEKDINKNEGKDYLTSEDCQTIVNDVYEKTGIRMGFTTFEDEMDKAMKWRRWTDNRIKETDVPASTHVKTKKSIPKDNDTLLQEMREDIKSIKSYIEDKRQKEEYEYKNNPWNHMNQPHIVNNFPLR